MRKQPFPVSDIRRFLEPGPIVLVTSAHRGTRNVMTLGWHTVLEFTPSLVGCMIAGGNHSHALIRDSGACVINLPTADMADTVVGIGNCSGAEVDKFDRFALATDPASEVEAPMLRACHASLECRLHEKSLVGGYNFFIFEVVRAHARLRPKYPRTLHYTGEGVFTLSGPTLNKRRLFRPEML